MRTYFIKLLAFALCALMILPILSCKDGSIEPEESFSESQTEAEILSTETAEGSTDTTEETSSDTTTVETELELIDVTPDLTKTTVTIANSSKFLYRMVRSDSVSTQIKEKITELRNALNDATGYKPEYKAGNALIDTSAYNQDLEILIGDTVRVASKSVLALLMPRDYFVGVIENKIVIIGGSSDATLAAIEYFMTDILSSAEDGKIEISKAYFYRHVYFAADMQIGNAKVSQFKIKYNAGAIMDNQHAVDFSKKINNTLGYTAGVKLSYSIAISTDLPEAYEIVIGPVGRGYASEFYSGGYGPLDYSAKVENDKLYICGGGEWAIGYVVDHLIENYFEPGISIPADFVLEGSLYGEQIFDFEGNSNLRIMANNVWSRDNNNTTWANMGENCSAEVRSEGFVACYIAFKPDVINVQEMSKKMLGCILENFTNAGYNYVATETIKALNIIYNTDTLELIEHGYHIFTYGCDGSSKGYAWALFEHKATGERFVSMSTHFWWKSESDQAGSDAYRERQAIEISEKCIELADTYNCPVFMGGDFNSRTSSKAMKNITSRGILNCFNAATESDDLGSHHSCGPEGFSRGSAGTNAQAIDHLFCYNLGDAKLNAFRRTQPYFFIKLSDHYPLYVDITLK